MRTIPYKLPKKKSDIQKKLKEEFDISNADIPKSYYSSNPRKIVVDEETGKRTVRQEADQTVRHSSKYSNFGKTR